MQLLQYRGEIRIVLPLTVKNYQKAAYYHTNYGHLVIKSQTVCSQVQTFFTLMHQSHYADTKYCFETI